MSSGELKASDLRIGNLVNVPREDQSPFRIDLIEYACEEFCKVGMNVNKFDTPFGVIDGHPITWELPDLNGIPLTEEWLLKFGFKHDLYDDRFAFEMGATDYVVEKQDDWYFIGVKYNTSKGNSIVYFSWNIYHVHQLQNLYHALTDQELTLTT